MDTTSKPAPGSQPAPGPLPAPGPQPAPGLTPALGRIVSMDQFRGYTVAGMFVVNFLDHMKSIHPVLMHHNTYFSYADSIMPAFLFAVGFSFRLTFMKRLPQLGAVKTCWSYFKRSMVLVFVSLMAYGFNIRGNQFAHWEQFNPESSWGHVARLIKADLWETLAVIGAVQLFILPLIATRSRFRLAAIVGCVVGHTFLTYYFNFAFVHALPNAVDEFFGTTGVRCWESGPFGIMSWSVAMLSGTLCYDIVAASRPVKAAGRLIVVGALFMAIGYSLSCLTRLYDVEPDAEVVNSKFAESPVLPPFEKMKSRSFKSMLAEPPFVPPPGPDKRKINYWMMTKQFPSGSFILFASGFAFSLYGLFVLTCDVGPLRVGVFRVFGQNPLAAYLIHHVVAVTVLTAVPKDAPLWYCMTGFTLFFGTVYLFVRHLEKHNIFIRM